MFKKKVRIFGRGISLGWLLIAVLAIGVLAWAILSPKLGVLITVRQAPTDYWVTSAFCWCPSGDVDIACDFADDVLTVTITDFQEISNCRAYIEVQENESNPPPGGWDAFNVSLPSHPAVDVALYEAWGGSGSGTIPTAPEYLDIGFDLAGNELTASYASQTLPLLEMTFDIDLVIP